MMGSGGMIVMDNETCMVDVARYFLNFLTEGILRQVRPLPDGRQTHARDRCRHLPGRRTQGLALLEELGNSIKESALCGLGKSAPNPVVEHYPLFSARIRSAHY